MGFLLLLGPLVGFGFDLIQEHAARPAELRRGAQVVQTSSRSLDLIEQLDVMAPGNSCNSLLQNFRRIVIGS